MVLSVVVVASLAVVSVPSLVAAFGATVSQTFAYSSSVQTFTVPAGITLLNVTMLGAEGGLGGKDATNPLQGGYQGSITGTLAVTPGQVITIGVGKAGAAGNTRSGSTNITPAAGGTSPIAGYSGGAGGIAGDRGSSGNGAGGGAATVIKAGTATIVAGGGGGGGGSGQYASTAGRPGASTFTARTDTVSAIGQDGITTTTVCTPTINCDGGASGAGGGGAIGGQQGAVAYGAGSSTEYYGFGGSPGSNDTSGLTSGSSVYSYYPVDGLDGSVTISYVTGAPDAPTAVAGTAADGAVNLTWLAPLSTGGAAISDYRIQYAIVSATPSWQDFADGVSVTTSARVTGLTNGVAYEFQVAAINSFGTGVYSAPSAGVTPSGVPGAPTLTSVAASDAAISVSFTAATAVAPITRYEYSLNGGAWVATGTASPFTITGLTDGAAYAVQLRAVNSIGAGGASNSLSATPLATPSAPSITSVTPGIATASVAFTPGSSGGAAITGYQYSLGGGAWTAAGTMSSPLSLSGLANGTTYSVAIRAISSAGTGAASSSSRFTTAATPGAPAITGITSGDGTLAVAFAAGSTGGLPVTSYQYQLSSGGAWTTAPATSSPLVITGLANGLAYPVSVRAVNAVGVGAASGPVSATPVTTPGPPSLIVGSVAGSNQELDAQFTAPTSDGGSPISTYQYSTDGGVTWRVRSAGTTGSPIVITTLSSDGLTLLTNGSTYPVEVRAMNAIGAGLASGVADGIARTSPDAPVISGVTSQSSSLLVDFAPGSNGGSPVTGYEYRLGAGAWTTTGSLGTEFVVPGLTDGATYSVEVRANNVVGAGTASDPVNGTPASVPGQVTITGVTVADRTLSVGWSLATTGGSPVTAWQYTTDGGATWATSTGPANPLVISFLSSSPTTALTNGVSYPIAVRAVNVVGTGATSPTVSFAPQTTPGAPTVVLTPQDGAISVAFTAGNSGGSTINDVQYSVDGGTWTSAGSLSTTFVIASLANGTSYGVRVRTVNGVGAGAASSVASAAPRTVPNAPTLATASPDGGQTTVAWTTPGWNGGSAITGYTATAWSAASGGTAISTCAAATPSCVITGLTNGTSYFVSVVAANVAGAGAASFPRVAVTPLAKPGAPTITSVVASNTFLTVNFSVGSAGSSPITSYQYSLNGGVAWVSVGSTANPIIISGLANGTSYPVIIQAVNLSGAGTSSNSVSGTPFAQPDVPDATRITATPGNTTATVTWAAPNNNGSAITAYDVVLWSASAQGTQQKTCTTTALSCTITAVTNGTTYWATVDAVNAAGTTVRSDPRVPVTPGAPGAVSGVTGTAGNASVSLAWTAGASGITPTTDYTVWFAPLGSTSYTQFADGVSTATTATVTGLTNGTSYSFVVYPVDASGTGQPSAPAYYTPLAPGTVPTMTTAVATAAGFTSTISNYSAGTSYAVSSSSGSAARTGSSITVTGLTPGQTSTVTVTASLATATTVSGTTTGTALLTGTAPTFGAPVQTATGYMVAISNYSNLVTYSPSVSGSATVSISGSTITVSGLAAGASTPVTLLAQRSGYTDASASVTGSALVAGIAPTLSSATRTANGYTFTITNLDLGASYALTSTDPNAAFSRTGSLVVVTGLAANELAATSVTASKTGSTNAAASISARALASGITPTFSSATQTSDGYVVTITNFAAGTGYAITTDVGTAVRTGDAIVVTGLAPGQAALLSVTASLAGSTDATSTTSATALGAGTVPLFGAPLASADGFSFLISNYSGSVTYSASGTNGATVSISGSTITVTGLAPGQGSLVTVFADRTGYTGTRSTEAGVALAAGIAPALSAATRSADGYSFTITNLDGSASYTFSSTNGNAVFTRTGSDVLVSGLGSGESATTLVTVTRNGSTDASASIAAHALAAGIAPALSSVTRVSDGYFATITNWAAGSVYSITSDAGSASVTGGLVSVAGLTPGQSAQLTLTARLAGSTDASTLQTGTALFAGATPTFGAVTRTIDGYTVAISNYSALVSYLVSSDFGTATIDSSGTVTVSGLAAGASATLDVTAERSGYTVADASRFGSALIAGVEPTLSAPTRTADGFSFAITNYDQAVSYQVLSANPDASIALSGGTVMISGLAPTEAAIVSVTASLSGSSPAAAAVSSSALAAGVAPLLSGATQTTTGYFLTISNYDFDIDYVVSTDSGAAVQSGDTILVSGLTPGQSAQLTVTSHLAGSADAAATTTSAALSVTIIAPAAPAGPAAPASAAGTESPVPPAAESPTPAGTSATTGSARELRPGIGQVRVGGAIQPSRVFRSPTHVALRSEGLRMIVASIKGGKEQPTIATNTVVTTQHGWLRLRVMGFEHLSHVSVWVYSTPALVAKAVVLGNHTASRDFVLPGSIRPGNHMLVVTGTSASGRKVALKLGFVVTGPAQPSAVSVASPASSIVDWWWLAIAIAIAVAVALMLLLLARRLRRRRTEVAQ